MEIPKELHAHTHKKIRKLNSVPGCNCSELFSFLFSQQNFHICEKRKKIKKTFFGYMYTFFYRMIVSEINFNET